MRKSVILLVLLATTGIALADQNSAFQDAKDWAGSTPQSTFSAINSGNMQDKIPGYGTNPAEAQYFQGGQGQLSGLGVGKMQTCATATPDPDPIKRQECEAVNFLARNPQIRPQFNISKNDPMFTKAKNIGNNAESIFQSLGMNGGTGTSTQCTTKTETTPAQYTTETCSSLKEVGQQQCTMGRTINIDADSNFRCEQTVNAYETLSCTKDLVITSTTTYTCPGKSETWADKSNCDANCTVMVIMEDYFASGCAPENTGVRFATDTDIAQIYQSFDYYQSYYYYSNYRDFISWAVRDYNYFFNANLTYDDALQILLRDGKFFTKDNPGCVWAWAFSFMSGVPGLCKGTPSTTYQWVNNCAVLEERSR